MDQSDFNSLSFKVQNMSNMTGSDVVEIGRFRIHIKMQTCICRLPQIGQMGMWM